MRSLVRKITELIFHVVAFAESGAYFTVAYIIGDATIHPTN